MSLILVDMDGVIADWGTAYGAALDAYGDETKNIARHADQRSFNLVEGLTEHEAFMVGHVMSNMDYAALEPIPGAIDALWGMVVYGHTVFICTSPWLPNRDCMRNKVEWVDQHLGSKWADHVIITKDKTLVKGDYLIDDKPEIKGAIAPLWKQVLFDQPYNREVTELPRLTSWDDWKNEDYK